MLIGEQGRKIKAPRTLLLCFFLFFYFFFFMSEIRIPLYHKGSQRNIKKKKKIYKNKEKNKIKKIKKKNKRITNEIIIMKQKTANKKKKKYKKFKKMK